MCLVIHLENLADFQFCRLGGRTKNLLSSKDEAISKKNFRNELPLSLQAHKRVPL